jgi:LacI family transcriptional regulator
MACDDNMGMKLLEACKAADIDIPEEVAILGVNNDRRNCELATPALSSIAMNAKKAGYDAAELLDDMIKSNTRKKSKKVIAEPVRIVARQSTNIFAVPDEFVVKALGFIVKNVNRQIQVTDAAEYVSISRRELERRFKRYLNRSIHQQIKYEKVKLIKKMLLESSDTISEIADKLGFSGAAHIGRYFKDVEGISPIEYRRKNLCTV